uniref:Peptidase n=1 Tax=viral metagenome TaxID=1070528 RepID=A0A6C0KTV5_9ZZZZ
MDIRLEASLETGDIVLFRGTSWISWLVEWFGVSRYSHVGIVIKNPKFLNPELEDGTYLLESSWNNTPDVEDHLYKVGVQLHLLDDILKESVKGSVEIRRVHCERNKAFYEKLYELHKEIHGRPYDVNPVDWLCAKYNIACPFPVNARFQNKKSFWCSALVSYVFCELGIIQKDVNWSIIAPREFSSKEGKQLQFTCQIDPEMAV